MIVYTTSSGVYHIYDAVKMHLVVTCWYVWLYKIWWCWW